MCKTFFKLDVFNLVSEYPALFVRAALKNIITAIAYCLQLYAALFTQMHRSIVFVSQVFIDH